MPRHRGERLQPLAVGRVGRLVEGSGSDQTSAGGSSSRTTSLDGTGQPLFPFGFGLSYTHFVYSALAIEPAVLGPTGTATIRCRIQNDGTRAGDEVVQLYLHDELASVARPVLSLAGFARVHLAPGEEREVAFRVGPKQLRLLDQRMRWVVEPGDFRVMVGSSSRDMRLRGVLTVR